MCAEDPSTRARPPTSPCSRLTSPSPSTRPRWSRNPRKRPSIGGRSAEGSLPPSSAERSSIEMRSLTEKRPYHVTRRETLRRQALKTLEDLGVLMRDGHFDYGNGFHGRVYLNAHQLFRHPSTIWRLAQDLLEILPAVLLEHTEVVAGPVMGGALLAHTLAGLLDGRRSLTHPPCSYAPFTIRGDSFVLRDFYARHMKRKRVLIADDVRNKG